MITKFTSAFSSFFMLFSSKLIRTTLFLWVLLFASAFSYYFTPEIQVNHSSAKTSLASDNCGCNRAQVLHGYYIYLCLCFPSATHLPSVCHFDNSVTVWSSCVCHRNLNSGQRLCPRASTLLLPFETKGQQLRDNVDVLDS
ncbi:hypothetical protein Dsin_008210 [Dipteronia sinensis]|uniref:Uncharacterized protein n=1 Tax=Dipteronia sinensis TaxID=43782 RepID=A0AAE0EC97_9ROSI|nr:hypothetical protein Dsin_008210 [Dipteronia sinensis]